jgi:hypothetical protein
MVILGMYSVRTRMSEYIMIHRDWQSEGVRFPDDQVLSYISTFLGVPDDAASTSSSAYCHDGMILVCHGTVTGTYLSRWTKVPSLTGTVTRTRTVTRTNALVHSRLVWLSWPGFVTVRAWQYPGPIMDATSTVPVPD